MSTSGVTVYSFMYKDQEYLVVSKGKSIAIIPVPKPDEKIVNTPIPAEAAKNFKW